LSKRSAGEQNLATEGLGAEVVRHVAERFQDGCVSGISGTEYP